MRQLTLDLGCQRWAQRRDSYRPAGETIRAREYEVATIDSDRRARGFIVEHHYLASYPAARYRFGLYRRGELVGVAVFSVPLRRETITSRFPIEPLEGVELGRFVLLDSVPANGETWFLARCFRELRKRGIRGVVSFSDPFPRIDASGRPVFPGHIGTIYQAASAIYSGRSKPGWLYLQADGSSVPRRALQKIRAGERGWQGVVDRLRAQRSGVDAVWEDRGAWLDYALPLVTRRVRHPGNHRYLFPLDARLRPAVLRQHRCYPKLSPITT